MLSRTNATTATSSPATETNPFERVTEDGTEYLVAPVVAQQADVYAYRINGDLHREYLPGEELTAPLEDWEGTPLVLRHPDAPPDTPALLSESGVEATVVGAFRDAKRTNGSENRSERGASDDTRLAGQVYIEAAEVGAHDGDLRGYIEAVRRTGVGEVSTGYGVGTLEETSGRHNGTEYDAIQRDIQPDHLALLPDQVGNCPVDGGVCGVGRANQRARTNHQPAAASDDGPLIGGGGQEGPDAGGGDQEGPPEASAFARLGRRVAALFGVDGPEVQATIAATPDADPRGGGGDADGESTAGDGESNPTSGRNPVADSGSDETQDTTMDDDDKIDTLVTDHGFDRENMEPLAGTECLARLHSMAEAGEAEADESGTDAPDEPTTPDGAAGTEGSTDGGTKTATDGGAADDPLADIDLDGLVAETVRDEINDALEDALDEQAGALAETVEEARQNEQHIQTVAESEQYPLDRDALEGMSPDAVAQLAETVDEPSGSESERANYAGVAAGPSFEAGDVSSESEETDTPVAGALQSLGGDE
jgi:hypothetical protein